MTLRGFIIVILLLLPNWPMDGWVSTAILWTFWKGEQPIVEKKLRRAGLSLKSFAKNLNRKCHCFKDCKEDWNTKMALSEKRHRSSVCRIAQRCKCCDIVSKWKQPGRRYSTNKIQLIFIKHSDVVAWVVFVTLNIGAFIIFTSWIWGFTASHSKL